MNPGTSSLVAAPVAVCAVLVACAAVLVVVLAMRASQRLGGARGQLDRMSVTVRQEAPRVRQRLSRMEASVESAGRRVIETEGLLVDMTATLVPIRRSIESITQGRLATLIHGAGIVSKVAQFALLWR